MGFSDDDWLHSFLIDVGKPFQMPVFPICKITEKTSSPSICTAKNRLAFYINAIRTELGHNLNETANLLDQLLPNTELPSNSKQKRAIFSLLGSIIHDKTGLSDEDEINQVKNQINILKKAITTVGNTLTRQGSDLSSFIRTINDRVSNAMKGVKQNAMQTQRYVMKYHNTTRNLERLSFLLSASIVRELANVITMNHQYDTFKQALADLAEGKLSPLLIKPTLLKDTINDIQNILTRDYPSFFLISTNPQYYYKHATFSVYRNDSSILITLHFPISSLQTFELYHIYSRPSPVNDSTTAGTQIKDLPDT